MSFCCPSCGTALLDRPDPYKLVDHLPIGGIRRAVLRTLMANFAREVPTDVVSDRVYAGVIDGGPRWANVGVRKHCSDLRKLLKPYGLTIVGSRYGTYRIDWVDAPAVEGRQ